MKIAPRIALLLLALADITGCKKADESATPPTPNAPPSVSLLLDWRPEPEFGGFYAAQVGGVFTKHNLNVNITSAGEGANMWQLVASGKADFATTAADQVLIARSQGADVVALFAVYQTSPQGVMVHKVRGFTKLADVFTHPGTLESEDNAWRQYCLAKFSPIKVTMIGLDGGIPLFLQKPDVSMQCFVTSEPLTAAAQDPGSDPQAFLIADSGYNPYTTVVMTSGKTLSQRPDLVAAMAQACREGWSAYLADPGPANGAMEALNHEMDAATFAKTAEVQKPLIQTDETRSAGIGTMTAERWTTLAKQLVDLKIIDKAPAATDCFVNPASH